MMPTATELEYFAETFRTQHISRAAIRLGISQPTLTQSLKKLEEKLGLALFIRTKSGVIPTREGTRLFERASQLLDQWKEIQDGIHDSHSELVGRFRVGCHQSVGSYTVPRLLENLSQAAPKIELDLIHDFSRKILERVVAYEIDLGFVVNAFKHPDLVVRKMGNDRVLFWKRRGLTKIPQRIFADTSIQSIESTLGRSIRKHFEDWMLVHSSSLELIRTLTLSGQGVGVLPERIALADGADLVPYREDLPSRPDEIYLVYRKEALSSRAGQELVKQAYFSL